ncbi:tRNA (guanosine(37)-N1)-methyltransferase TrmD [Chrysiogenes arsenatis]|uniref:tRNA (guanosine(37)-N1)-methyltransferase TrmD n=1 Tax=Chrysiogenes arsenatis TaxID=309797 RepID=UPI0004121D69|nr:tRNA (guanosine(37)-N1)-methyltransferase TrmD [Chrysiogenes arsenatis]
MRFDVVTLFPDMVHTCFREGVVGRAVEKGILSLACTNPRDFTHDVHRTVDDTLYGGGSGMLLKAEPLCAALESIPQHPRRCVVYLSPQGERLNQALVRELAMNDQLVLICGRYEGIDQRVIDLCVDREISLGDYVISGGELAAAVVIDAVSRLVPGVVGQVESVAEDSFFAGLLDAPHYTRPRTFRGHDVPAVLLGGNHLAIESWREEQMLKRTFERRPDLLEHATLTPEQEQVLKRLQGQT